MDDKRIVIRARGGDELCCPVRGVPAVLWSVGSAVGAVGREHVVVVTGSARVARIAARAGVAVSEEMVSGRELDARSVFVKGGGDGGDGTVLSDAADLERVRAMVEGDEFFDGVFRLAAECALWRAVEAGGVQGVICDVDGTLTDGKVHLGGDGGGAGRSFHTHDGLGTQLLMRAGVRVGWLSATSDGGSIEGRAKMIGVEHVDWGQGDKGARVERLCGEMGVEAGRAVYIGDDVNDLPAMRVCGASATPADGAAAVRREATLVLERRGGHGAMRELAEVVLATL